MSNINIKTTVNVIYEQAKAAIRDIRELIKSSSSPDDLTLYIYAFEDIMHGISGEILKLEKDQLIEIKTLCQVVVNEAAAKGATVNLFKKLLPDPVVVDTSNIESVLAKKLYPLTTVVRVEDGYVFDSKSTSDSNGAPSGANTAATAKKTGSELSSTITTADKDKKKSQSQAAKDKQSNDSSVSGLGDSKADDYDRIAIAAARNSAAALDTPLTSGLTIGESIGDLTASGAIDAEFLNVSGGVSGVTNVSAEIVDEIDVNFDEIDDLAGAEAFDYERAEPMVYLPEEFLPLVPNSLLELVTTTSSNANGLQAGLTTLFTNPLANIIEETKNYILTFNADNYAGLNAALGLSSGTQYAIFRDVMGGGDGYGGIYAQLEKFKDHTDRLSGLVVDENSENAEPSRDNTVENFEYFGLALNTPTTVISFDAKKFRSAKYYVQATAQTEHQMSELYVLHDTKNAFFRQVDTNYTKDPFISFTSSFVNNTVNIIANTTVSNTDLVMHGVKLQIASKAESYEKISLYKMLEMHERLNAFYRDGTNYLGNMANSLMKFTDVVNLKYQLETSINSLKASGSGGNLLTQASVLSNTANVLQSSIDSDHTYYRNYRKTFETIDLSYLMARNYNDDPNVKTILDLILNNSTKEALQHTPELDEFDEDDIIDEYLEEQDEE